jgi:hypothetical protein
MIRRLIRKIVAASGLDTPHVYGHLICSECGRVVASRDGRAVRHVDHDDVLACRGTGKPGKTVLP